MIRYIKCEFSGIAKIFGMKVVLSSKTPVFAVRLNNEYRTGLELESRRYIHNFPFKTLLDAVDFAFKILEVGEVDLQYWEIADEYDLWDRFLVRDYGKKDRKYKAHIWDGLNTLCKMWSTGGLGYKYDLFKTDLNRDICTMCFNKLRQKQAK